MRFIQGALPGLLIIEPKIFRDGRGFFYESYRRDQFREAGLDMEFVQDNHSSSCRNTVRGLHYQTSPGQAKLIRCIAGRIWDVVVDIRPGSATFGQWAGVELTPEDGRMIYIPIGFAHGFAVLSDHAEVLYKCSAPYNSATEAGIAWNDPAIGVDWKVTNPILSLRDQANPKLTATPVPGG